MIIDDYPAIRDMLFWQLFLHGGYSPLYTFSRVEAVRWIREGTAKEMPEIVLLDLSLSDPLLAVLLSVLRSESILSGRVPIIIGMTTHTTSHVWIERKDI